MAAVFNLNHHATYVHWHFIQLSLPNVLVLAAMLVVFALAILLPFPQHKAAGGQEVGAAGAGTGSGGAGVAGGAGPGGPGGQP